MKPKHSVRLSISYPRWEEGPYGTGTVGQYNFNIGNDNGTTTLDELLVQGAGMARQFDEWMAEESNTLREIYHPDTQVADHVDIYRRPKTYFGAYVLMQSVYIDWIEKNLVDSEAEIADA